MTYFNNKTWKTLLLFLFVSQEMIGISVWHFMCMKYNFCLTFCWSLLFKALQVGDIKE